MIVTLTPSQGVQNPAITGGNGGDGGSSDFGEPGSGGGGGVGIYLQSAGSSLNLVSGSVIGGNGGAGGAGGIGVVGSGISLVNSGTIAGGLANKGATNAARSDAIEFIGGSNSLALQSGSIINGAIEMGGSGTTLALAQPTDATLSNAIIGTGSITKTGAGTLTLSGANTFAGNVTIDQGNLSVSNDGNLGAPNRFLVIAGGTLETNADGFSSTRNFTFDNIGTIQVDTGTTTLTGVLTGGNAQGIGTGGLIKSGVGTLALHNGFNNSDYSLGTTITAGTLDLFGSKDAGSGAITFAPGNSGSAALDLEMGAQNIGGTFTNTLTNFNTNTETLDLKGFAFNVLDPLYLSNGRTLTVMGGTGGTQSETFTLSNGALAYTAQSDGAGGTLITALCFAQGTRIATSRGDVAVEALRVGDVVVTASGATRPIRWLGYRDTDCHEHPDQCPIRVAAHAFGVGLPNRDLCLSPGHPVLVGADESGVGGHLVPIMCLINGTTIERLPIDEVTYWHIELDQHDILLAEGLPAESYIDLGSRPWFEGADGALYDPDMAAPGMPGRCRPVAVDGPIVEDERRRLDLVFASRLSNAAAWPSVQNALLALF